MNQFQPEMSILQRSRSDNSARMSSLIKRLELLSQMQPKQSGGLLTPAGTVAMSVAILLAILVPIVLLSKKKSLSCTPGANSPSCSAGFQVFAVAGQVGNLKGYGTPTNAEIYGDVSQGPPGFIFRVVFDVPRATSTYNVQIFPRYAFMSGTPVTSVENKTTESFDVYYQVTSGPVGNYNIFRFLIT